MVCSRLHGNPNSRPEEGYPIDVVQLDRVGRGKSGEGGRVDLKPDRAKRRGIGPQDNARPQVRLYVRIVGGMLAMMAW